MKKFLYTRGEPGNGKITNARILEKELNWFVFVSIFATVLWTFIYSYLEYKKISKFPE